jgi:membrane-bound lytic murein transglycosylase D
MTQPEQTDKNPESPQISEKPQATIPETDREIESVQPSVTLQKRKDGLTGHEINPSVQAWIERLSVKDRSAFKSSLSRLDKIRPTMEGIFKQYGFPKDMVYLCLVESNANPALPYHALGATGYWQFYSPDTAKRYGLQVNRYVDERKHLEKSTHAAAQYLKHLYSIFGDWYQPIAAYNAGEWTIIRLMKNHGINTYWDINRSMDIKSETIDYVPKYIATVVLANNREAYGLPDPPQETGSGMPEGVDSPEYMSNIARSYGGIGPYATNKPDFITDAIPISSREKSRKAATASSKKGHAAQSDTDDDPHEYITHTVRKGDTLYSLARKYSSSVNAIAGANRISPKKGLPIGKTIIIPEGPDQVASKVSSKKRRIHTVASGETLKGISGDYGVSVEDIISANDLKDPALIQPGSTLVIPASKNKHAHANQQIQRFKRGHPLGNIKTIRCFHQDLLAEPT